MASGICWNNPRETMTAATGGDSAARMLIIDAKCNRAGQAISAHFIGGARLNLGDAAAPYPVDLPSSMGRPGSA
jgi:hypothetical protein